ncbi:circadian clock KaiB family protein [Fibrella forsythiae]|uniref:Circadian clock KaiB family protein n=1 Tax=Fibrella forsythiae TaxID=2817061 RepID=A0ABS3JTE1_9BACT|nr:circadian clock KaiB family protein [Fibrella forsythiae]MBO0953285.1 circadian clock KaiB family protein [Fibrella forsythiae]
MDVEQHPWVHLYTAGNNLRSQRALLNLTRYCERYLRGNYTIHVIDLRVNPQLAQDHQILAVPTLVKVSPLPRRKVIGDLYSEERVRTTLGMP